MRELGALEIARLVRADTKNSALPIIALGDGSQRALMDAFQAGCDDYIDRARTPAVIASHVRNIVISKVEGFQPTQMLPQADTSLSGSLTHHDLPGVMQMLGHAHQTGALHVNSGDTDALLFFDAGTVTHAECGSLFGDEAVIHILKNCMRNNSGVYKFVYGSASAKHTVLRCATDLMLDAMREIDESARAAGQSGDSTDDTAPLDSPCAPLLGLADPPAPEESAAIAAALDNFAASIPSDARPERSTFIHSASQDAQCVFEAPLEAEPHAREPGESKEVQTTQTNSGSAAEPEFANYSIVPYAGNDLEDIT
jgi:hypothetical protein